MESREGLLQPLKLFEQLLAQLDAQQLCTIDQINDDIYRLIPQKSSTSKTIGLVGLTHGDEIIGIHIINELLFSLIEQRLSLPSPTYLIIANRQAYLQQQRYVDTDLNRAYGFEGDSSQLEEQRVQDIKPVIDQCDYVIDFHQTIEETLSPFFILPYNDYTHSWANNLSPTMPIIARNITAKITTLSTYVASRNKLGLTFEVGSHGVDPYQVNLGITIIRNLFDIAFNGIKPINSLRSQPPVYSMSYFQPYSQGQVVFSKVYKNFEVVEKGDTVATVDGQSIKAPLSGNILLYPQKWFLPTSTVKPDGLFFILEQNKNH
jgi:succinylglutamate desuccinylase